MSTTTSRPPACSDPRDRQRKPGPETTIRRPLLAATLLCLLAPAAPAGEEDATWGEEIQVTGLDLGKTRLLLVPGAVVGLTAEASARGGKKLDASRWASWSIADPSVASVDGGLLTATGMGETTITATWRGVTSAPLTVRVTTEVATDLELTPNPVRVYVGRTVDLDVEATLPDGRATRADAVVTYEVAHPEIAVVDGGRLRAKKYGATTVWARLGSVRSPPVDVRVLGGSPIVGLTVEPALGKLPLGAHVELKATGVDAEGFRADLSEVVRWTSSDPAVARIGEDGVLDVLQRGSADLVASIDDVRATPVHVETLEGTVVHMRLEPPIVVVNPGDFVEVAVHVLTSTGEDVVISSPIDWRTEAFEIADVKDGLVVGGKPGRTDLTVSWVGGVKLVVPVYVPPPAASPVAPRGMPTLLRPGQSLRPGAVSITAAGEVDVTELAQWVSIDPGIVRVEKDHVVEAVAPGAALLYVGWGGRVSAPVDVLVSAEAGRSLRLTVPRSLARGASVVPGLTVDLVDGTSGEVGGIATLTSSGPAVVVQKDGTLKAAATGRATLTATWEGLTATAEVVVP